MNYDEVKKWDMFLEALYAGAGGKQALVMKLGSFSDEDLLKKIAGLGQGLGKLYDLRFSNCTDNVVITNCLFNLQVYRHRFDDLKAWWDLIADLEGWNEYQSPIQTFVELALLKETKTFNDEEMMQILADLRIFKFYKEFDDWRRKHASLLGLLYQWRGYLNLEFWQGAFDQVDISEDISYKDFCEHVNYDYRRNGEEYFKLLWELRLAMREICKGARDLKTLDRILSEKKAGCSRGRYDLLMEWP